MATTIGVIGGSGLYELEGLANVREVQLSTPFGHPSDSYICGELQGFGSIQSVGRVDGRVVFHALPQQRGKQECRCDRPILGDTSIGIGQSTAHEFQYEGAFWSVECFFGERAKAVQ